MLVLVLVLEGVAGRSFEVMEEPKVADSGDPGSKDRGGKTGVGIDADWPWAEEWEPCRWRPSMWSGSGDGMRARGPSSDWDGELYELERIRCVGAECSCR